MKIPSNCLEAQYPRHLVLLLPFDVTNKSLDECQVTNLIASIVHQLLTLRQWKVKYTLQMNF